MSTQSGFSLLEVLVAIVVFSVGALGVASTLALALRTTRAASAASAAARLGAAAFATVAAGAGHGAAACADLPAPRLTGMEGATATVRLTPSLGGSAVVVVRRFRGPLAPRVDSASSFLRCR